MRFRHLTIVEVGPRDGFQSIAAVIPTTTKLDLIDQLYAAGIRRMEATAFVSAAAVPQLADAGEVMRHAQSMQGLDVQVLVPNLRNAQKALDAGAAHLAFVLSVSEKHNQNNVRRTPLESVEDYRAIADLLPDGARMRLNVATAFDCPWDGKMPPEQTLALLEPLVDILPDAEICLCDTTGKVTPDRVSALFAAAKARFPQARRWAYHGHDTYGLGVANVVAAWNAGINVIDASFAGLGGCPFAPGATGNVATEDVVWTFEQMGISTGLDLGRLVGAAVAGTKLPGALIGGRVRDVLAPALGLSS
ncbi:Hydroxymethylglutaryl-CoA lyase YngG [Brevundimonas sp. SH203]|uniref:hydroxymethylglutaryl-CoA lyase n=1 Tax=Brevundimonas sp. SH203 TaxID=345167 RepID=UPI0009CE8A39|nr:hydroxymethylglutaryl-CoA lyase [Brevundimonas sp. SH203]GAW40289.1 Hydroxymethylglutaryl-CoA lyase YngG [Brevundimonas sp. SH203]